MATSDSTKQCTQCKQVKPLSEFHKRPDRPLGVMSECKTCNAERKRRHIAANPQKHAQQKKASYERLRKQVEDGRVLNSDKADKYCPKCRTVKPLSEFYRNRVRYDGRAVHCKSCMSKYHQQDRINRPEIYKGRRHIFYLANKDVARLYCELRRARKAGAEGSVTKAELIQIHEEQEGMCAYCGIRIFWEIKRDVYIDHIVAITRNGSNWPDNIALVCQSCSSSKNNRLYDDWVLIRGW